MTVACDYRLIGEDIYAAGVYISREPVLLERSSSRTCGKLMAVKSVLGVLLAAMDKQQILIDLINK